MTHLYPTQNHPSCFHLQKIVYPVVSRRSGGVSIGINLSPSKRCNFACIYCQVHCERLLEKEVLAKLSPEVDFKKLEFEIRQTVETVLSGRLFSEDRFRETSSDKRTLRDFAFSGDGEPTLSPQFGGAVRLVARLRDELAPHCVKLVLITNATTFQNPETIDGCDALIERNGEIWAKLDGGTEEIYRKMNRSHVRFSVILDNLRFAASRWPIKIQTMFLRYGEIPPSSSDVASYIAALEQIRSNGGNISSLQLYTVARPPIESNVSALRNDEMDAIADEIRNKTGLKTEVFYSR